MKVKDFVYSLSGFDPEMEMLVEGASFGVYAAYEDGSPVMPADLSKAHHLVLKVIQDPVKFVKNTDYRTVGHGHRGENK